MYQIGENEASRFLIRRKPYRERHSLKIYVQLTIPAITARTVATQSIICIRSNRLNPHSARRIIQKRASDAGVEGFISGHSLRVGSAVSLAQAGATVVDMQVVGRWKSSQMPAHYAKAELAERGAIARFKDGKR